MPTYRLGSGRIISISPADQLGKPGGEGTVYGISNEPDIAVKIYHQTKRSPGQGPKLLAMLSAPPDDPTIKEGHRSICWPLEVVLEGKVVVGFVMPRLSKGMVEFSELYFPPSRIRRWPWMTFQHIVAIGGNIASAFEALHAKGYVVGDVNCKNWMIREDCRASVIDTDSFQVPDASGKVHFCRVAMPGYMAPELAVNSSQGLAVQRTTHQDDFSLAVLLFQLLVPGQHPTRGVVPDHYGPDEQSKINAGAFPWAARLPKQSPLPSVRHLYDSLDPAIRALFERSFIDGYRQPDLRPTPTEWRKLLHETYKTGLVQCSSNAQHWFFPAYGRCVWCQHAQAGNVDLFPGMASGKAVTKVGSQISVPSSVGSSPSKGSANPPLSVPIPTPGWSVAAKLGLALAILVPMLLIWLNQVQTTSAPSPKTSAKLARPSPEDQSPKAQKSVETKANKEWVITDQMVGPLRIGARVSEASRTIDTPIVKRRLANQGCDWWMPERGFDGVAFLVADDVIAVANIWGSQPTSAGLRVGNQEERLKTLYGNEIRIFQAAHPRALYSILHISPQPGHQGNRIVFRMLAGQVVDYFVGDFSKLERICPELASILGEAAFGSIETVSTARIGGSTNQNSGEAQAQTPVSPSQVGALAPSTAIPIPTVAMAQDRRTGCHVWKPSIASNDAVTWSGNCVSGFAEGLGTAQWMADGKNTLTYEGTFRSGLLQGRGKMTAAGGDRYEGDYRDGKREGRGVYISGTGDRYDGEFRDNKRDGRGTLIRADGIRVEGNFMDGKLSADNAPQVARETRAAGQESEEKQRRAATDDAASRARAQQEERDRIQYQRADTARKDGDDAATGARAHQMERERIQHEKTEEARKSSERVATAQVDYQKSVALAQRENQQLRSVAQSRYQKKQSEAQRVLQRELSEAQRELQETQSIAQAAFQAAQNNTRNQIALSLADIFRQQSVATAQAKYQAAQSAAQTRYQQALSDAHAELSAATGETEEALRKKTAEAQATRRLSGN